MAATRTGDKSSQGAPVSVGSASSSSGSTSITPLLVTATQAARTLSIGRTALYHLIWDGELTPVHIGRSVRFSVEELEAFVQRRLDGHQ